MTWHYGRLVDHVHLRARDFEATRRFYEVALLTLGRSLDHSGQGWFQVDELFVDAADANTPPTHIHLAFQARDRDTVDRFYQTALTAGGKDNGAPGERSYHPGYYACFVLDPDGNNIEAVFHGPAERSAESVELRPITESGQT